jgi:SagB-type dehydrogenase family enzyme
LIFDPQSSIMASVTDTRLETVLLYHERTKHHPNRYARSLGYMDWATQPNPFRLYQGAFRIPLPHPEDSDSPEYDALFTSSLDVAGPSLDTIGRLFYDSLSISAWKQSSGTRWSLRVNPSSGNLHPTEAYLVSPALRGGPASPAVFHYSPLLHALEHRADLSQDDWGGLADGSPQPILLVGLTSIYWRESWKYGERGFRYCQHDVGHAAAAVAIAAAGLGWGATLLDPAPTGALGRLLGVDGQSGPEREHAECLLALYAGTLASPPEIPAMEFADGGQLRTIGEPNRLSDAHHSWPVIDEVAQATEPRPGDRVEVYAPEVGISLPPPHRRVRRTLRDIVRRRRSAVAMDGITFLDRDIFFDILGRTLAHPQTPPHRLPPWRPAVSLACMVHRVRDLQPGLYLLSRHPSQTVLLRDALDPSFDWVRERDWPDYLPLYRLRSGDYRTSARLTACHQEIASDGAVSFAMLARFSRVLEDWGPWAYRRLFWETGLVGQILYLEAEAAGVGATGIGCFFDDPTHEVLGLRDRSLQSLYHFTIGGGIEDSRLQSLPAYFHLDSGELKPPGAVSV